MKFTPPSNPNSTVTPTIMGLSNPGTESSEVIYTPTIMSLGISEEEIVESFTLVPMGLNNPEFESKILFIPSSMDWADPNSNCVDCVPIFFNPIKTSCCDTPTTPSDGGQITWDDILDKPICFPACLTPLENIFVPLTRTITINGETHGLSSDQTWTVDVPSYLSVISPLLYDNTTGVFSIQVATTSQGGYLSSTDWNKFNTAYILRHNPVTIGTANGLSLSTQVLSLGLASTSTIGALSATDWNIFNNKQNALGYIPENIANKSISTSLGTSNVLYPTQLAVKTYVDAAISGFFILQGDWDASTNTPDLTTGPIPTGYAWRVSVAGTTNLGGITDWDVNDVAAKTATGWIKFDNSNSVTSVNGYTGAVVLTTTEVPEPLIGAVNLYWTPARSRGSVSSGSAELTYSAGSGQFTITPGYSIPSSTDTANWNIAYAQRIDSLTTTGSSGAATLISNILNIPAYTLAGLGGISLTSLSSTSTGISYNNTTGVFSDTSGYGIPLLTKQTQWDTAYTNRITSLTVTGNSGSATLISNVLNIPTYTLAGLGGIGLTALSATTPLFYNNTTGVFTIQQSSNTQNGYLSASDWITFNSKQTALSGTGFVKISGTTISYDNSTYYLASNPNSYIALTALSSSATGLTYTNTTGVFSLTVGYIIPTTASTTNWDAAYNDKINSITFTPSTLTLNQQDGGTVSQSVPTFNQNTTGNAATSTRVYHDVHNVNNVEYNLPWFNGNNVGNTDDLYTSAGLTYNPSLNRITANLNGNAATATLAANSTLWNGESIGGVRSTESIDYGMIYSNTDHKWHAAVVADWRTWLGSVTASVSAGYIPYATSGTNFADSTMFIGSGFINAGGYFRATSLKSTGRIFSTGDTTYDDLVSTTGATVLEYDASGSIGYVYSRNHSTSTNMPLHIYGSTLILNGNGSQVLVGTTSSLSGDTLQVNGSGYFNDNLYVGGASGVWLSSGRGVVNVNGTSSAMYGFTISGVQKAYVYYASNSMAFVNNFGSQTFNANGTDWAVADGTNVDFTGVVRANTKLLAYADGTNASGTWPISITGSSATTYNLLHLDGPRNLSDRAPNWSAQSTVFDFVNASAVGGSGNYGGVMTFVPWDGTTVSTGDSSYQLAFANWTGYAASGIPMLRLRNGIDTTWNAWYTILHSGNYDTFSPHLDGTGATGTWGISITGNAATSNYTYEMERNSVATDANTMFSDTTAGRMGWQDAHAATNGVSGWANYFNMRHENGSSRWGSQIAVSWAGGNGDMTFRTVEAGTWTGWRTLLDSSNYNSYVPSFTGTGASGYWGISIAGSATQLAPMATITGVKTGRNFWAYGAYTYNSNTDPNAPATYFSAIGLGNGESGSAEIGVAWAGVTGIWYRSLRDTTNPWTGWHQILDDVNYNNYSPTLTGTGASGTWGINISGYAPLLVGDDNRVLSPSEMAGFRAGFGFTAWNNDGTAPYADFLHFNGYSDSSGGNQNLLVLNKAGFGMRLYQGTYGSTTAYSSFKDIAFADGSNSTGTWAISITGNADTVDGYHASNFLGFNGTTRYQASTWIEFASTPSDNFGLYFPSSASGTHFHPTVSTWGSFTVSGSKSNYTGFDFDQAVGVPHVMFNTTVGLGGIWWSGSGYWAMVWDHSAQTLQVGSGNYTVWHSGNLVNPTTSSSLTTNYLSKASGAHAVADSNIFENGTIFTSNVSTSYTFSVGGVAVGYLDSFGFKTPHFISTTSEILLYTNALAYAYRLGGANNGDIYIRADSTTTATEYDLPNLSGVGNNAFLAVSVNGILADSTGDIALTAVAVLRTVENESSNRTLTGADNNGVFTDFGSGPSGMYFFLPAANSNIGVTYTIHLEDGVSTSGFANSTSRIYVFSGDEIVLMNSSTSALNYIDLVSVNGLTGTITLVSKGNNKWISTAQNHVTSVAVWNDH